MFVLLTLVATVNEVTILLILSDIRLTFLGTMINSTTTSTTGTNNITGTGITKNRDHFLEPLIKLDYQGPRANNLSEVHAGLQIWDMIHAELQIGLFLILLVPEIIRLLHILLYYDSIDAGDGEQ